MWPNWAMKKIDIIEWVPPNLEEFIKNALSPAKVLYVRLDESEKVAHTVVPNDQLSLAIGKEGQNARLAARLTGWRIDIKDEEQAEEFFAALDLAEAKAQAEAEAEAAKIKEAEAEKHAVEAEKPAVAEISEEELASLTNVMKRKSWQERFGTLDIESLDEEGGEDTPREKQEPEKAKKKKEKVITDLSQLDSIDFKFDDEK